MMHEVIATIDDNDIGVSANIFMTPQTDDSELRVGDSDDDATASSVNCLSAVQL